MTCIKISIKINIESLCLRHVCSQPCHKKKHCLIHHRWQYYLTSAYVCVCERGSQDSVVTRLLSGQSSVSFLAAARDFSVFQNAQTGSGAHQASYLVVSVGSFARGKAARAWSWPLSVEVKNEWSHTSALPVCLHGVRREPFTVTITCLCLCACTHTHRL